MKKTRVSTISELSVDVVDYLFVEWLRRRGVFSAFRLNCGFGENDENAFRTSLRYQIRSVLNSSRLGIGDLISMSFIFAHTPEGLSFWFDLSFAWRRFCIDFQIILNNIVMMKIHVVIRRINPAIKVDLVQIGRLEDGQFTTLPLDTLKVAPFSKFLECSSVSDSPYIEHHSVLGLIAALISYPNFAIEFSITLSFLCLILV